MKRFTVIICIIPLFTILGCSPDNKESKSDDVLKPNQHTTETSLVFITDNLIEEENQDASLVQQEISKFENSLKSISFIQEGKYPTDQELLELIENIGDSAQLIPLIHDQVYKNAYSYEHILFLCTNAIKYAKDANTVNELLHYAGTAAEATKNYSLALELHNKVIDRAETGISTKEASDSAMFCGDIYSSMADYEKAASYYKLFGEFSDKYDHNHNNVVFSKVALARVLCLIDQEKGEALCREMIEKEPDSIHKEEFIKIIDEFIPWLKKIKLNE